MALSPRLLRPRAPSGFNPKTIAGLAGWWDASSASSVTLASGAASQWNDLSGNGYNAVQSTAGSRPTTGTVGGRSSLFFDGTDDELITTLDVTTAITGYFSAVVAVRPNAVGQGARAIVFGARTPANQTLGVQRATGGAWTIDFRNNVAFYNDGNGPTMDNGVAQIFSVSLSASSALRRKNGAAANSITAASSAGFGSTPSFLSIGRDPGQSNRWAGDICEILFFNRTLSVAELIPIERYLAAKWGITLAPQVANADAQSWIDRVYSNGGTVSTATAAAVNTFCTSIESAGIRDRFYRLNLFAGSNLSAALVPLYRGTSLGGTQFGNTTDTNNNFVSGDYSESGAAAGLTGNGSTKYLATGLPQTYTGNNSIHQAIGFVPNTAAGYQCFIGARYNLANSVAHEVRGANANFRVSAFSSGQVTAAYSPSSGRNLFLFNTNNAGANSYDSYSRGAIVSTLTMGSGYNAATTGNFMVFAGDTNGTPSGYYSGSADFYSIGARFTSSTQVDDYHAAIAAFRTALSRT